MSDQLDLSTLPQRMRYAARVLEETSEAWPDRTGCQLIGNAREKGWTAQGIAQAAGRWEAEDRAADELDELANWLSAALCGWLGDMTTTICRRTAEGLIESGWSKGDPE